MDRHILHRSRVANTFNGSRAGWGDDWRPFLPPLLGVGPCDGCEYWRGLGGRDQACWRRCQVDEQYRRGRAMLPAERCGWAMVRSREVSRAPAGPGAHLKQSEAPGVLQRRGLKLLAHLRQPLALLRRALLHPFKPCARPEGCARPFRKKGLHARRRRPLSCRRTKPRTFHFRQFRLPPFEQDGEGAAALARPRCVRTCVRGFPAVEQERLWRALPAQGAPM